MNTVAVVGGGISGLAAAYALRGSLGAAGSNTAITVLEAASRVGGKLRTIELAGQDYDVGAEAFLARRPEVGELASELGLDAELVHPSAARACIRAGGRSTAIPSGTVMGVPASADAVADVLPEPALQAVAGEPTLPPVALDGDISVGALLRQRFGPEVVARLVDPLLGGVYAGHADTLGLRATMPSLAEALDAGDGSLLRAAASVLPRPPGASTAPSPPVFGAFRGGYAQLIDRLVATAGAEIRLGSPVRALLPTERGWELDVGAAQRPTSLDVDAVVLAVPPPAAAKLLHTVAKGAAGAFADIVLASTVVVGLAYPTGTDLPPASGTLVASSECHRDGTPFTAKAFTYSSSKWPHLRGGPVLVRASVGRAGEVGLLQRTDEELVHAVRADLAELTGVATDPVDVAVARWGGALPQYGVGHLELVARIEAALVRLPRIAVAGAALHGVGVPACIATGRAAAARIAAALG